MLSSWQSLTNQPTNQPTNKITYREALEILSPREVEVLKLVEKGYSNKEIGMELNLSVRTVHVHRNKICRKIGVKGRGGLTKWIILVNNKK